MRNELTITEFRCQDALFLYKEDLKWSGASKGTSDALGGPRRAVDGGS